MERMENLSESSLDDRRAAPDPAVRPFLDRRRLKKCLSPFFLLPFLLVAGSLLTAVPVSPIRNIPRSNAATSSYPFLSYKIFMAVLDPWMEPLPPPEQTVLRLPDAGPIRPQETILS